MTAAPQDASPESPRYFFRDPLAAAWMAKHFGMKIESKGQGGMAAKVLFEAGELQVVIGINADIVRYYIHTDSLQLLVPQVGDLVRTADRNSDSIIFRRIAATETDTSFSHEDWFEIVQRKGKAFHWPEQEAA